jgi:hypothetical protein
MFGIKNDLQDWFEAAQKRKVENKQNVMKERDRKNEVT